MSDDDQFAEIAKAVAHDSAVGRCTPAGIAEDAETPGDSQGISGPSIEPPSFKDIVERTKQVFTRSRIVEMPTARNAKTLADLPATVEATVPHKARIGTVRIACVESELDIWSQRELSLEDFRDGCKLLKAKENFRQDRWVEARLKELNAALALKPDVICFPEFAYPPPPNPREGGWTLEEIGDAVGRRVEFEREAIQLLGEDKPFLFLGSFHCPMTLYNVGIIYPWGSHPNGREHYTVVQRGGDRGAQVNELQMYKDFRAPIMYRKRFPARKIGEQTRVPAGRGFNVYERAFGKVMVLICSDILDINQFMTVVREGTRQQDIDLVLVPAYNPAASFGAIARELSNYAATMVVVVNANDPDIDLPRSELFVCGEASGELPASKWVERQAIIRDQGSTAGIRYFDIDFDALCYARSAHIDRLNLGVGPMKGAK